MTLRKYMESYWMHIVTSYRRRRRCYTNNRIFVWGSICVLVSVWVYVFASVCNSWHPLPFVWYYRLKLTITTLPNHRIILCCFFFHWNWCRFQIFLFFHLSLLLSFLPLYLSGFLSKTFKKKGIPKEETNPGRYDVAFIEKS